MKAAVDTPIAVGLIGHGDAGAALHAPLIEAAGVYRIVGVSTSRPDALSVRRDGPRWEPEPGRLISANDVDLVVVATPNDSHYRYAREALMAGKAVVVEKPFVTTPAEADELIRLSRTRGLMLTVFHNRRLDGDYLCLRKVVSSGALGPLKRLEARWDRAPENSRSGWRNELKPGAGLHWDLGSHLIDQVLELFGEPLGVGRRALSSYRPSRAATGFELELTYANGLTCVVSAQETAAESRPRFHLIGARGSLTIRSSEARTNGALAHAARRAELVVDGRRTAAEVAPNQWDRFYPRLAAALRDEAPLDVTADQAARVVDLLSSLEGVAPGADDPAEASASFT